MIDYLGEILIFFLSASFASLWADSAFLSLSDFLKNVLIYTLVAGTVQKKQEKFRPPSDKHMIALCYYLSFQVFEIFLLQFTSYTDLNFDDAIDYYSYIFWLQGCLNV